MNHDSCMALRFITDLLTASTIVVFTGSHSRALAASTCGSAPGSLSHSFSTSVGQTRLAIDHQARGWTVRLHNPVEAWLALSDRKKPGWLTVQNVLPRPARIPSSSSHRVAVP